MAKKSNTIITSVFVDIEDSTGISNYLEKEEYKKFLSEFHKTIQAVLKSREGKKWQVITGELNHKFMGDEFIAFFPHAEVGKGVFESALQFAATLKFEWYFSKYNQDRLWGDKEHIELNIGINTGDISLMEYPILSGKSGTKKFSYEGFPITLAKRIQSVAEESQSSRIVVADRFYREYSSVAGREFSFQYMGRRSFKGIAQRFSCYEWLGSNLSTYLNFGEKKDGQVEKTLKALYDKNPHNPWYASLLAHYYFFLGEEAYYDGNYDNNFYRECAQICIDAIYNISTYNLRELNEILFICLEVGGKWDELCIRTEQAFSNDPTFSSALALNAKSLFMKGNSSTEKARDAAERLLVLFRQSKDYESLFNASFVLSRYYAKIEFVKANLLKYFRAAVDYAQKAKLIWAEIEYTEAEADFENIKNDVEFRKEVSKLKKIH